MPDGVGIHPECEALTLGDGTPCNCRKLYGFTDLDSALEHATRKDLQRSPYREIGSGPDADEALSKDSAPQGLVERVERGLWKESEYLRCRAGLDFVNGDMDMSNYQKGTWQRAREAQE